MKMLKSVVLSLVVVCLSVSLGLAKENPLENPDSELKVEVTKMIDRVDLTALTAGSTPAVVEFMITNEQKLVVLNVNTSSSYLESAIKGRLNYKEVKTDGVKRNKLYRLKVTFVKQV